MIRTSGVLDHEGGHHSKQSVQKQIHYNPCNDLVSLTKNSPYFRPITGYADSKSVRPELQNTHPMLVDCVSPLGPPIYAWIYSCGDFIIAWNQQEKKKGGEEL